MKLTWPPLTKLAGLLGSALITRWMNTLDYRGALYDPTVDPAHPDFDGPKLYVFWHENILCPLHLRGRNHLTMLLSQHRDGDILEHLAHRMGFGTVRGSTYRGGAAAMRELIRRSKTENLIMTPDGPRGPRRVMSQGPIYLASKLGLQLVLTGFGYDRPWRLNSWDRFAIPRPWSRARAILGPPIYLPKKLDRDGIEHYRSEMERMMNSLTDEAQAWADAGTAKLNEVVLRREPMRKPMPSRQAAAAPAPQTILLPQPHMATASHLAERRVA